MRQVLKVRLQMLASLVVFGCALMVAGAFAGGAAADKDCDNNAIMKCGFTSSQNFIDKVNANAPKDLKTIYSQYGLAPSRYSAFVTSAKNGQAYRDGRIVVDGQVVGHASQSIGRQKINGNTQTVPIGGKNYYGGPNSATFSQDSLPVSVLFNSAGTMVFAVLQNCGNPETITAITPQYSCDQLHKTAVSGHPNTYRFTTESTATKNATFVKAVYDFGDGNTQTVTSQTGAAQHTFTSDSTVKVTVYVRLPGATHDVTTTSTNCQLSINYVKPVAPKPPKPPVVTPPPVKPPKPVAAQAACTSLQPDEIDADNNTYRFTATATYSDGAAFNSADFNFGDGVTVTGVIPSGDTAVASHSYSQVNNQTILATLHFTSSTGVQSDVQCQTALPTATTTVATQYCKPGVIVGSPDCITEAVAVSNTKLINTGTSSTSMLGIFAGLGLIGAAGHYWFRRRLLTR